MSASRASRLPPLARSQLAALAGALAERVLGAPVEPLCARRRLSSAAARLARASPRARALRVAGRRAGRHAGRAGGASATGTRSSAATAASKSPSSWSSALLRWSAVR